MSTTDTLTLDTTDATVKAVVAHGKRGIRVYGAYVAAHTVNADNIAAHVAALTEIAYPGVKGSSRAAVGTREYNAHNFRNTTRACLKRAAGIESTTRGASEKFATAFALKCDDRDAAVAKFVAEWDAAHASA